MPDSRSERRLVEVRGHIEAAHREVQAAQKLAYERWGAGQGKPAPLRVRLALNRAQNTLIKLLVHRLPHPPLARPDEHTPGRA